MKNFYMLTPREAFQYFIHHQTDVIPAGYKSKTDVSITIPTHRTAPDNKQDPLNLKNLINEVEKDLLQRLDKREVAPIVENLKKAHEEIDYSHNLDALVVYANEHFVAVVTLAIEVEPDWIIGKHFDTRPLFKARQQTKRYYLLAISKKIIRLLEMRNDKLIHEFKNADFPFENDEYYTTDPEKLAQDSFKENLLKEYINVSDKRFKKYLNANHLPVVLAGDIKMMAYYTEMMDNDRMLIAKVHGNYVNMPVPEIINHVYPVVREYNQAREKEYLDVIDNAQSANRLVVDYDEINRLSMTGNVQTLFIGDNLSLKGRMDGTYLILEKSGQCGPDTSELTVDILSHVQKNGGKIVFLEDGLLDSYQGMALIKKY
ncbi:MAG: hypothetical protein LIP01_00655 [Tannerellaceae bacterium]|nr:hypothetical protein [Tannerellaceae bacterium]